jgi:1,4-dihydroxy-2-naphthoate octaprenyltransferase
MLRAMDAKTLFLATRPWSFTMTFSSVTLATLIAALGGHFNPLFYLLALGGMIAFHAATNLINDFYDVRHSVDKVGAPTTKYRPHPSASGEVSPYVVRRWAAVFFALAMGAGACLAVLVSLWILPIMAIGLLGSLFYTADPVVLKSRALGEVTAFAMWGLLIPLGSYIAETGQPAGQPVLASVPIGIFVALVLLANNIRDTEYDGSMEATTVAVRFGRESAVRLYGSLLLLAYVFIPALVVTSVIPPWCVITFLTAPGAVGLWKMFVGPVPDNADPRTAGVALQFSILYMAAFVLQMLLHLSLGL